MHRYTPSTASTVLNEYLREFQAKLRSSLEHAERSNNAKEADRLRKVLLELDEYEHDVLLSTGLTERRYRPRRRRQGELSQIRRCPQTDTRGQYMTTVATLIPHLERRFADYRIVFWHDPEGQYGSELDTLDLPGVCTVRIAGDEFAVKNRLLHDQPTDKFLIYRSGQVPSGIGNWLLDLELAYGVFTADRSSLVSQDLGLTAEGIDETVRNHENFFNASKRVQSLKALLMPDDDPARLLAKMSAVVLGQKQAQPSRDHPAYCSQKTPKVSGPSTTPSSTTDSTTSIGAVWPQSTATSPPRRASTTSFTGSSARRSTASSLIVRAVFRTSSSTLRACATTRRSQDALSILAKRASTDLDYKSSIEDADFRDLVNDDLFEETDRKIISALAKAVAEQTVTAREVAEIVRSRQSSVWIDGYRELYIAIDAAAELLSELSTIDFTFSTFDEGLERYRTDWFRIDQLYRHFTHARRTFEGPHPLEPLREQVEKRYTNKFAYELGNAWQKQVDQVERWASATVRSQRSFYRDHVGKLVRDDKKAVVIISDALRYEVAEELGSPHPAGGSLRCRTRGHARSAAELHPAGHGSLVAASHAQAFSRREDRPRRPTNLQTEQAPARRSSRR